MSTTRNLITALAVAAVVALALPPSAASARYGNGGGGGGGGNQQADLPANVKVKVKGGDLVMSGSTGTLLVEIIATAGGLRVQGRGDTKINGKDEPFETDEVTGDWKLKFGRARASELTVEPEDESSPRPKIGKLTFVGGLRAELHVTGVDVDTDVKVNMNRTLVDKGAVARLEDVAVGGDVKLSARAFDARLFAYGCTVAGKLSSRVRPSRRATNGAMLLWAIDSDVGEVSLRTWVSHAEARIERSTVQGACTLIGETDVDMRSSTVRGDLTIKANLQRQDVDVVESRIDGATFVVLGRDDDDFTAIDSTFGLLDVRTGAGDDDLVTNRSACGEGSVLDGQKGKGDSWLTSDAQLLETRGIETIDAIATD